jgi:HK97 family phage prohead protease
MKELKRVTVKADLDGESIGQIAAVFSTFNTIDSDGDVVRQTAFTDGQEVPMVWAHDWQSPVGKGVIRVQPDRAVFEGAFFMDTFAGEQAYRTVKAMGDLQEWSWGFRILDAEYGEFEGEKVQFINEADVFEVSPVLVGANRETMTLAIKGIESALAKYGARNSRADLERLQAMRRFIDELIGDIEEEADPEDAGKQADAGEWKERALQMLALEIAREELEFAAHGNA